MIPTQKRGSPVHAATRREAPIFDSNISHSRDDNRITRRVVLAGGAAGAVGFGLLWFFRSPGVEASTVIHGTPGKVTIVNFNDDGTKADTRSVDKILKSDGEWYRQLGSNSFNIARRADTEMPHSGVSWNEHRQGIYRCLCCATALFSAQTKFDSGTGWPSFWAPLAKENVAERPDNSLGVDRTEVQCTRCEAHLGHVFPDGPEPTGLRYCMNSASMHFIPAV